MGLTVNQFDVKLDANLSTTSGVSTVSATFPFSFSAPLTSGTAANMADKIYSTTVTLGGSATADIDLAGSLTDVFGAALTFAKIKAVIIYAAAANNAANAMQVTRTTTTGIPLFMADGDGISLDAGQIFVWGGPLANGKTITAGTDDTLTFTNSAGTNTISATVIIIGTSA